MKRKIPKGLVAYLVDCLTVGWEGGLDEPVEIQAIDALPNDAGIGVSFLDADGNYRAIDFVAKEV